MIYLRMLGMKGKALSCQNGQTETDIILSVFLLLFELVYILNRPNNVLEHWSSPPLPSQGALMV